MTPLPESWGLIAKILLVPNLHFLLFILLPGLILLVWLQKKWQFQTVSASQGILLAAALGLLYNTIQFMAVMTICHFLYLDQLLLVRLKFLADLLLLIVAVLGWRRELSGELRRWGQVLGRPRNIPLTTLAGGFKLTLLLLTPFDLWNLIKDLAQWYLQIVSAVGILLLFLAIRRLVRVASWRRVISLTLALSFVGAIGWSNRMAWFARVFQPLSSDPIRRLHYDVIHDVGVYYFPPPRNGKKYD